MYAGRAMIKNPTQEMLPLTFYINFHKESFRFSTYNLEGPGWYVYSGESEGPNEICFGPFATSAAASRCYWQLNRMGVAR